MSKFHQISSLSFPPLWEVLWTNLDLSPIKALNCQSVNRQLLCQVLEEEMSTPAPLFRRRKCSQVCQWVCANEACEEI